jgi:hypothetical protein
MEILPTPGYVNDELVRSVNLQENQIVLLTPRRGEWEIPDSRTAPGNALN